MLSFTNNQPVLIFSKGEGNQNDIWGVEVKIRDFWWISDDIFVNFDGRKRSLENINFVVNVKAGIQSDLEKIAT